MIRHIIFCATFLWFSIGIISEENTGSTESTTISDYSTESYIDIYNPEESYCFRFTWLGPGYDNSSEVDGSCDDLSKKHKLKDIPCQQPLVITTNSEPPNMTDIFLNYREYILCRRTKGLVCLKYSYRFNGKYDNITYMCGKALTEGEGAETSGCYSEYNNGYETEVCICKPKFSSDNGRMPCNSANAQKMSALAMFALCFCFLFPARLARW